MSTIYTDTTTGRQVYESNGNIVDAKTAEVIRPASAMPSLPSGGGATPLPSTAPQLPETPQPTSPLLSYASALDAAVNLARQHRNASSFDIMKPFQGTVAASDFNSILGNLNNASDTTSKDLLKRATEANTTKSDTVTIGGDLYQVQKDSTGKIVGTPTLILKSPKTTDNKISDTELKQFINKQIATPEFQALSPEEKALYIQSQGGTPYDFGFNL